MSGNAADTGQVSRRAFWTGAISIGLVNIPVRLSVMVKEHTVPFRLLHKRDGQPVRYERVCTRDNEVVPWEEIARGFEVREGEYIMIDKGEIEAIRPESDRRIRIDRFIHVLSVDPVYFDRTYLLLPDGPSDAYALLRETFRTMGKAGIGRITLRTKEYPVLVREYSDALILTTLHYPDEVTDLDKVAELSGIPAPGKKELSLAEKIVTDLSGEFDIMEYHDTYRERIEALISSKMAGTTFHVEKPKAAEVRDLMSALEETLARLKAERTA
ncbi:MAG: Ku protein [Methanoregulaceae archaeon]|nr:Ku protein [Methanoregulaceae archaeon]